MSFKKAERKNARLRLAISGVSGSGKTYSALLMAKAFGSKIAVMDSERGSASLYVGAPGIPDFDVEELEEHSIQTYLEKISEAAKNGYDVLVVDSFSHQWTQTLEVVTQMGGWAKAGKVVSPMTAKLINSILSYPGHVIATMRSKTEYALEQNDKGKVGMRKLGLAPVARPDSEYDFTVWLEFDRDGTITVSKSRCGERLPVESIHRRNEDLTKICESLNRWLIEGAPLSPRDAMADRIRFAQSDADLTALMADLGQLTIDDRKALKPVFEARKAEFA